jgi:hypothetical protein
VPFVITSGTGIREIVVERPVGELGKAEGVGKGKPEDATTRLTGWAEAAGSGEAVQAGFLEAGRHPGSQPA